MAPAHRRPCAQDIGTMTPRNVAGAGNDVIKVVFLYISTYDLMRIGGTKEIRMRPAIQLLSVGLVLCTLAGPLSGMAPDVGPNGVSSDSTIAGRLPAESGAWRTRTQQVFDPVKRMLVRRLYTVWDPEPSRNLDFVWIPDALADDREGAVTGQGQLIWRIKGKPAYDPASIFAEFRGFMKDGRADGRGRYFDSNGLTYEGEWKNGVMEGHGRLKLPNTDEYVGQFRA